MGLGEIFSEDLRYRIGERSEIFAKNFFRFVIQNLETYTYLMYWRLTRSITFLIFFFIGLTLALVVISNNKFVYLIATSLIGLYWLYRSSIYGVFSFLNFFKLKKLQKDIKSHGHNTHCIIIACYGESYEVLAKAIKSTFNQEYPSGRIYVFVSLEERKLKTDKDYANYELILQQDFEAFYNKNLFITTHPDNIANEVPGAASNKSWCAKFAYEVLTAKGENLSNVIATIPDADTIFENNYLRMLDLAVNNAGSKRNVFFQPVLYKVLNNFSEQYFFTKALGNTLTLSILGSSMLHNKYRYTFSCFSLYLETLVEVNYWDTSESIDDTLFYWRLYNHYHNQPQCLPVHAGISVEGIRSKNFFQTLKEQYDQFYRWGWGAQVMPGNFRSAIQYNKSNIRKTLEVLQILDRFVLMRFTGVFILSAFLMDRIYSSNFWEVSALICILIFLFGNILQTILLRESGIKESYLKKMRSFLIDSQLSIIFLVFFGFIPFLHAGLDMMIYRSSVHKIKWSKKL